MTFQGPCSDDLENSSKIDQGGVTEYEVWIKWRMIDWESKYFVESAGINLDSRKRERQRKRGSAERVNRP